MAEVTNTGYKLKTQNEWFDEEKQLYLDIDPLWNLDPSTPDGLKLAHDAEVFSALDEALQQAYNSKDPNKATGIDLDIISALTGTKRSAGTASTINNFLLQGVPGTVVPVGTVFESATTGTRWTLDQTWTLDGSGIAFADITATVTGPVEADANTITKIINTVSGLTSVNNPAPATPGTSTETDSSLRVKRATAVGRPGNNQIDSMLGELYAVSGVRRLKIYENDTNTTDVNGLPPHSIAPIIDGGLDTDIALGIYLKKNPGVMLYQAADPVQIDVASPTYPDMIKTIKFSRPYYVDMILNITIKNDGTLPSNTQDLIRDAFMSFAAGGLIPAEYGLKVDGFDIGETVPYSTLFIPVNKGIGKYGNSYVQSMTVNGGTSNVAIAFNQLSRWTTSNITVTLV